MYYTDQLNKVLLYFSAPFPAENRAHGGYRKWRAGRIQVAGELFSENIGPKAR
jgi:hypothetical protein